MYILKSGRSNWTSKARTSIETKIIVEGARRKIPAIKYKIYWKVFNSKKGMSKDALNETNIK